jgi:LacI family transcriptional regulator
LEDQRLGRGLPPLFVLARESQIEGVPAVSCDAEIALGEIGAHLVSRGYRKPGFMPGPQTLSTALGRRRHFKAFWRGRNVNTIPELPAESYCAEAGAEAMRRYLETTAPKDRIDVLMCENDILAIGALDVIRSEFGLSVPADIAVVGFDDAAPSAAPVYDLTTYAQPIEEMVKAIIDMILGRREKITVNIRGRLVVRAST